MNKHIARATDQEKGMHALPYGFLLTRVFENFGVSLRGHNKGTNKDIFYEETLKECDCIS